MKIANRVGRSSAAVGGGQEWTQWTQHVLTASARKLSRRKGLDEVDAVDEGFGLGSAGVWERVSGQVGSGE